MASLLAENLQQAAQCCCQEVEECEESAAAGMEFINILATPVPGEHIEELEDLEPDKRDHCEHLLELAKTLLDPSTNDGQILLERIGWELPQVLVNYNRVSDRCREFSSAIIDALAKTSSPRELLVLFMEALSMDASLENVFFCRSIIHGLGIVFSRVQKRHIDYFEDIASGLLRVARHGIDQLDELLTISRVSTLAIGKEEPSVKGKDHKLVEEIDDGEIDFVQEYVLLAQIIRDGYSRVSLGDEQLQRAQHFLGLFVLQLLGIASSGLQFAAPSPKAVVLLVEMSSLLSSCGLALPTLLDGHQIVDIMHSCQEARNTESMMEQDDSEQAEFDDVQEAKRGAALAVFWALEYELVDKALSERLELHTRISSVTAFLEALNLASTLLVSNAKQTSWQLVEKGVSLMQSILEAASMSCSNCEADDWSTITVKAMPVLQLLQGVVVTCGKPDLRTRTFSLLKGVITKGLPEHARFEALRALINNSPHPSVVSLLFTCLTNETARAWPKEETSVLDETSRTTSPFVKPDVVNVVEDVLERAGRDILETPTYVDSVLGALNLYRSLLIRETSGSTNYTGIRSRGHLKKMRERWLLPLREALGSWLLSLEKEKKTVEIGCDDVSLALGILMSVLHRCLELVEESLKESNV